MTEHVNSINYIREIILFQKFYKKTSGKFITGMPSMQIKLTGTCRQKAEE